MGGRRRIELLAPARDLQTARVAIQHGADAVYIGAPKFGARSAVGVSLVDLQTLCAEAHLYGVRIYVTLNTIIYDHELAEVEQLIWDIYRVGADALIIQDMGITLMNLPPIPLHSSTQCDTTEPEDVRLLDALGFEQIVVARELNVEQVRRMCAETSKPIEVFVHGALCVSYSGRCYISQAFTKRSANRGECSQQCRMAYDLRDSRGTLIRKQEHLLSPRDMNRSQLIEDLLFAGVSSFKIEGRLKGINYVKNVVAYYRKVIDQILSKYPESFVRASYGKSKLTFSPNPIKSFNRGFTDYQFHMPTPERPKEHIVNLYSPKSQGEYLGTIKQCTARLWVLDTDIEVANGDGLLYVTPSGVSSGISVNRSLGNGKLIPARPLVLPIGTKVYRNHDQVWEKTLGGTTAERRLPINVRLSGGLEGLRLSLFSTERSDLYVSEELAIALEQAKRFDADRLKAELRKMGDTIFEVQDVEIDFSGEALFVPLSILSQLRRNASEKLLERCQSLGVPDTSSSTPQMPHLDRSALPKRTRFVTDYRANISNSLSRKHYQALGYEDIKSAFELNPQDDALLMCTKYCIKHELGYCTRETKKALPYAEPLFLEHGGAKVRLEFDCKRCEMHLIKA